MYDWLCVDWWMAAALVIYLLAIATHVRLGRKMYARGDVYASLSSSSWKPDDKNARQLLLLGMYRVVVPMWLVHVAALVLVLFFAHDLASPAGTLAAISTGTQALVVLTTLGLGRTPYKILFGHYVLQTIVAGVWAYEHGACGCWS